jgi:phosphate transport system ATP-binding protein
MSHIQVRNLQVAYGKHEALKEISLDIPDCQITAIIGPSGCGKTTLLKSLNRLLDLQEDVLALRKKVGFMSQRPYPLPMSIYNNIAFGPRIHGLNGDRVLGAEPAGSGPGRSDTDRLVEYYLRLAGLWDEVKDRLHAPASRLSIGQQQRLALARALAVEPEVVLADEPTSALDPISAKLVENQFKILKKDYTIIVVTHILRQARRLADYILFLYMGELVEHGPAERFFNDPRDERTRSYISGEIS